MAAIAEAQPAVKPVPKRNRKVLMYSTYPGLSISVEKANSDNLIGQDNRVFKVKRGQHRYVIFEAHRAEVEERDLEDKTMTVRDDAGNEEVIVIQEGIRKNEGYGRDFIEAIRTETTPKGAPTLMEWLEKNPPTQAMGFLGTATMRSQYAKLSVPLNQLTVMKECLEAKLKYAKGTA